MSKRVFAIEEMRWTRVVWAVAASDVDEASRLFENGESRELRFEQDAGADVVEVREME
jgi:hypothetical protein